jgi:hypothetical protein
MRDGPASGASAKGVSAKGAVKKAGSSKAQSGESSGGLEGILERYARDLAVVHEEPENYYLDTRARGPNGKPLFFGAVRAGKAHTSFHLMPVYVDPGLLAGMSPALAARMHGRACFNFKTPDPALFEELERLTARCFERWKATGLIG